MGLTSALNTSLNGMNLNETSIDVIGNNIANAGTNGFKASEALFATQLARTLSVGSGPTPTNGGTNPRQIGLGASVATIAKDFTQGAISNSTSPSDLAIQGDGFFIVGTPTGAAYTRNGSFSLSAKTQDPNTGQMIASRLQTAQGYLLQGYGVDANFNLVQTQLTDLEVPLGDLNVAQQTMNISVGGALYPSGNLGTQGALITSSAMTNTSGGSASANPIVAGTLLTSVFLDGSTTALFTSGQTLTFSGAKGGRTQDAQTLTISGTTTVGDLLTLMDETLGIQSGAGIPNDPNSGGQPGVGVTAGGELQIVGNQGLLNDLVVQTGDLVQNGTSVPLTFTKSESSDGESAVTDFIVYDSLGEEVAVKMTAVLASRTTNSTTFQYFLESADDSDSDVVLGNGTITFDSYGNVIAGGTSSFMIDRDATAAASPMQITADFTGISGLSSATAGSRLLLNSQDGSGPGTLSGYNIDENGIITGTFDNGVIRTLGQVVLARFSNNQGLLEAGDSTFTEGVNSGPPLVGKPGTFGIGSVRSGAIELSNTDIGQNLVDLIVASTNYRGNARVISSVQQLVNELLVLGR
jgi:flagellar hook protein FlgE